jgi:hypothetical protein
MSQARELPHRFGACDTIPTGVVQSRPVLNTLILMHRQVLEAQKRKRICEEGFIKSNTHIQVSFAELFMYNNYTYIFIAL